MNFIIRKKYMNINIDLLMNFRDNKNILKANTEIIFDTI